MVTIHVSEKYLHFSQYCSLYLVFIDQFCLERYKFIKRTFMFSVTVI